jgi:anti-sigma B factor antagonist
VISLDDDGLLSELGPLLAVVVPDTVLTEMHLVGELDLATAQILDTLIEQQIATGHLEVRLDLGKLAFCDVLGTRALLRAHRRLAAAGGQLVLLRPAALLVRIATLCHCAGELGLEAGVGAAAVGSDSATG